MSDLSAPDKQEYCVWIHSRDVSTLFGGDEVFTLLFGEAFEIEVPSLEGRTCLAPLEYEEDGRADDRDEVEGKENKVLSQTCWREPRG